MDVALLTADLTLAKAWSAVFRRVGVIPHVYPSLEKFWSGVESLVPSLALVDIRQMTQGERQLRHHPLVESERLNLAFYGTQETAALFYSTYDILNLGIILGELPLDGQIKSILKRFNEQSELREKSLLWERRGEKVEDRLSGLIEKVETLKEKDFYQLLLKSMTSRFETYKSEAIDFEHLCSRVFASVPEVSEFAVLELSQSGRKLISPSLELAKFKSLPALWLDRSCSEGIELFAQNRGTQICLEVMGEKLITLLLHGHHRYPEKMVFIKGKNEEFLNNFDGESLEHYLSGVHSYYRAGNLLLDFVDKKVMEPWELFTLINQIKSGGLAHTKGVGTEKNWALIDVHFGDLIQVILKKEGRHFHWTKFFKDFFYRFETEKKREFHLACFGVEHVALLVRKEEVDQILRDLRTFSWRYSFWHYFEDVDIVLEQNLRPHFKMIPFSSEAYLRYLERGDYLMTGVESEETLDFKAKTQKWEDQKLWKPDPLKSV